MVGRPHSSHINTTSPPTSLLPSTSRFTNPSCRPTQSRAEQQAEALLFSASTANLLRPRRPIHRHHRPAAFVSCSANSSFDAGRLKLKESFGIHQSKSRRVPDLFRDVCTARPARPIECFNHNASRRPRQLYIVLPFETTQEALAIARRMPDSFDDSINCRRRKQPRAPANTAPRPYRTIGGFLLSGGLGRNCHPPRRLSQHNTT